jgi:hypothetical protein
MDTPQTLQNQHIPIWRRPADRRTKSVGFRIFKDQDSKLKEKFEGNSSALIRILIDMYFGGELPSVDEKLKKE